MSINDICYLFMFDLINIICYVSLTTKTNGNDYIKQNGKVQEEKKELSFFLNLEINICVITPIIEEILYRFIPYHFFSTNIFIFVSIIAYAITHFLIQKTISLIIKKIIYINIQIDMLFVIFGFINGMFFHKCYMQTNIICSILFHIIHNYTSIFFAERLQRYLKYGK